MCVCIYMPHSLCAVSGQNPCLAAAPPSRCLLALQQTVTNPGTGTGYLPTALPTVGPYALPVPSIVPGFGRGWSYLRKEVLKLVFFSQSPYKFVNLFFSLRIS